MEIVRLVLNSGKKKRNKLRWVESNALHVKITMGGLEVTIDNGARTSFGRESSRPQEVGEVCVRVLVLLLAFSPQTAEQVLPISLVGFLHPKSILLTSSALSRPLIVGSGPFFSIVIYNNYV